MARKGTKISEQQKRKMQISHLKNNKLERQLKNGEITKQEFDLIKEENKEYKKRGKKKDMKESLKKIKK